MTLSCATSVKCLPLPSQVLYFKRFPNKELLYEAREAAGPGPGVRTGWAGLAHHRPYKQQMCLDAQTEQKTTEDQGPEVPDAKLRVKWRREVQVTGR